MSPPKIYFAGKIAGDDWRSELSADNRYGGTVEKQDPVEESLHERNYLYTGPFFRDYHGMTVGENRHGAAYTEGECEHGPVDLVDQQEVAAACLSQIYDSDAVYARIEPEAYGTLLEIGYAFAHGKKIFIAGGAHPDCWFAGALPRAVSLTSSDLIESVVEMLDILTPPKPAGLDLCESPVEEKIYRAFTKHCAFTTSSKGRARGIGVGFRVYPQWTHRQYRLDFAVLGKDKRIALEIDGHDFHERTKEQASSDKARDRALQVAGWLVFRFTGSDAHRDPDRCVEEVLTVLRR